MFNSVHVEHGLALPECFTYHAAILPWYGELRKFRVFVLILER